MVQEIGSCSVTFNSVNYGSTIGGVSVTLNGEYVDLYEDQHGRNLLDKIHVGDKIEVKCRFATSNYTLWSGLFKQGTASGGNKVTFGRNPGLSALAGSALLVLHPIRNGSTNYSEDIGLYKAAPRLSGDYMFDNTEEAGTFEVTFEALCDTSRTTTDQMGYIGGSGGA